MLKNLQEDGWQDLWLINLKMNLESLRKLLVIATGSGTDLHLAYILQVLKKEMKLLQQFLLVSTNIPMLYKAQN